MSLQKTSTFWYQTQVLIGAMLYCVMFTPKKSKIKQLSWLVCFLFGLIFLTNIYQGVHNKGKMTGLKVVIYVLKII